jgi:hypothetical protein
VTASPDFEAMLRMELTFLTDEQARIAARMDAVEVLLGGRPPEPDTAPVGADVPVKATTPRKATRKSLRAGLSAEMIEDIRSSAANGYTYNHLGEAYSVSRATIGNIVQRKGCYS